MNETSTNQGEATTNLYSSAFSELTYHQDKSLIVATWKEHSKKLIESGVKAEITRLLDQIKLLKIRQVVVDARHYAFTNNPDIQQWINSYYVPRLMETTVEKYGFVVERAPSAEGEADPEAKPRVEYFTSLNDALNWID
jgi:hypothetical protein